MSYQDRIMQAFATGKIRADGGGLLVVTVMHDDGCPALNGGECTCEPDVKYAIGERTFLIKKNGEVEEITNV